MKQFFAFASAKYYPGLGMEDFVGSFDDRNEAATHAIKCALDAGSYSIWNVYDSDEEKTVLSGEIDGLDFINHKIE